MKTVDSFSVSVDSWKIIYTFYNGVATWQGFKCSSRIGVSKYCRNTTLLDAMKIHRVKLSRDVSQLDLIRTLLNDTSRARTFYLHLLNMHLSGQMSGHVDLLSRVHTVCKERDISFVKYVLDQRYSDKCRMKIKNCFNMNDGLVDSVRQQLWYHAHKWLTCYLCHFNI